jgi:hypothetical protein
LERKETIQSRTLDKYDGPAALLLLCLFQFLFIKFLRGIILAFEFLSLLFFIIISSDLIRPSYMYLSDLSIWFSNLFMLKVPYLRFLFEFSGLIVIVVEKKLYHVWCHQVNFTCEPWRLRLDGWWIFYSEDWDWTASST